MKLLKNFSLYTISSFFGAGVGFILMPILTHYLSPSDYGTLSLFNTYVAILIPIISLNVGGYFSVEYYKNEDNTPYLKKVFSNLLIIPSALSILFFVISYFSSHFLEQIINIPQKFILLIPILALLTIYYEDLLNLLVIKKNAKFYTTVNIIKVLLEASLTILFVIILKFQWEGRVSSWLFALCVISIIGFIYLRKQNLLSFKFDKKIIKNSILFGSPLIAHNLGKLVINQSDRIFISKMVSIEEVGVYNTGYLIGSIITILSGAFVNIYSPYLYERLSNITFRKKLEIVKLSYISILTLFVIFCIICLVSPYLYKYFINKKYIGGIKYIFWTGLAYVFWGVYLNFAGYLFYFKKTSILAVLSIINVLLNLLLNYYLINSYGAIGASYATCISFLMVMLLCVYFSNKTYPMPWFKFKLLYKP